MKIKKVLAISAAVLAVAAFLLVACQEPEAPAGAIERGGLLCSSEGGNCVESWNGSGVVMYSGAGSGLTFQVDGATGAVLYGGDDYPVGNPVSGKLYEFGATGNITSTVITPVAITTVTAYGCNVRAPAVANAWSCGASLSGRSLTLTTYELDATPVATPAKGVSWWIAGN